MKLTSGSNAILYGIGLNRSIIYYDKKSEFYINPLFKNEDKINKISNIDDLHKLIKIGHINNNIKDTYISKVDMNEIKSYLI